MNKNFFDTITVNIMTLALLVLIEALQFLIIVVFIYSFIPIPPVEFVQKLFPLSLSDVHPKRDSSFYHIWIVVGLGLQALLMFLNNKRLSEVDLWRKFLPYVGVMAGFIIIQVFFIFKIILWGNPWWARDLFYLFLGFSILARIFWPEFRRLMEKGWGSMISQTIPPWARLSADIGVILVLFVLVFSPDLSHVLARIFSYDKFYHLDSFIMSPAWAHHNNLILNKDVTSEYSLIIPIFFDGMMRWMGGFSYAHAVSLMIALCAGYYFLLYGLWRYWTTSVGLSFFAVILSVKLQFFHWGVVPLIWIYPSATPLRSLMDVFFLFFILRFTQTLSMRWFLAAATISGIGLVWTMDVGIYMYVTLLIAGMAYMYERGFKVLPKAILMVILPWLIAMGILTFFYGSLVGSPAFWKNVFEFAGLFLQGWGALPLTDGLNDKQFFAFWMGFIIPIIYTGTLLFSLGNFLFKRSRPYLFMLLICVYGLGLYHYFIHRSGVTSYYAVIIPFVFVLIFWAKALLELCGNGWQKAIKIFLCVWALTALTTGFLYTYYPGHLNLSGYDWSPEKKFYDQDFDFNKDASLIDGMTHANEPVALLSSFETKILIQANRRPYFYYFPMMESEHMQGAQLRGIYLHTYARLERTLKQLQDQPPEHVFIQTRLWQGSEAQDYEANHEGFKQLMAYIHMHYRYQIEGQYLTALQLIKAE